MKLSLLAIPLIFAALPGLAQEPLLPYASGGVEEFLEKNRSDKKPSVVLYNFDLESG